MFNNLYTQTAFFDGDGNRTSTGRRDTYFTSIITLTVGVTPRFNVGLELYPKSVLVNGEHASPFSVLNFTTDAQSRTALAAVTPNVKFVPFTRLPKLAFRASLYIPVSSDLEGQESGRPFLDYDDVQTWLQAFYDLQFNSSWLAYLESGFFFRLDSADDPAHEVVLPAKAIMNYYPTDRLTLYAVAEATPSFNRQFGALYTQFGAGLKVLVTPRFEVETLATIFPVGVNKGAGQTYNLGFRWVR